MNSRKNKLPCVWFSVAKITRTLCVVSLLLSWGDLRAQERFGKWGMGISGGFASFAMNDLKEYQNEVKEEQIFDAHVVKSFPMYVIGSFHILYEDSTHFFDFSVGMTTSGSRLSYSDYSGEYAHDLIAIMKYTSIGVGFRAFKIGKITAFAGPQVFVYSNILKDKTRERIYPGGASGNQRRYVSANVGIGPILEFHQRVNKHLLMRVQTAYELHVASGLVTDDDDREELMNSGKKIKMQAQGVRLKFGVVYMF